MVWHGQGKKETQPFCSKENDTDGQMSEAIEWVGAVDCYWAKQIGRYMTFENALTAVNQYSCNGIIITDLSSLQTHLLY